MVNEQIRADLPVRTAVLSLEEARRTGAIAPFGEKYGASVRVITMGESDENYYSREFCGGTHVERTGQIGLFVIIGESSVASGIRRIEAKTGAGALAHVTAERETLARLSRRLSAPADSLEERIGVMQDEIKALRRQADEIKAEAARRQLGEALAACQEVDGIKLIVQRLDGAEGNVLNQAWDEIKVKSPEKTVGIFAAAAEGKVSLIVGATGDIAPARLSAGDILRELAGLVGGKGGGKPVLARGGGTQPEQLDAALAAAAGIVQKVIKK
jgi:alanyl-tRNA synthetase